MKVILRFWMFAGIWAIALYVLLVGVTVVMGQPFGDVVTNLPAQEASRAGSWRCAAMSVWPWCGNGQRYWAVPLCHRATVLSAPIVVFSIPPTSYHV